MHHSISFQGLTDQLYIIRMEGEEEVSQLFLFTCLLYSEKPLHTASYIGCSATITILDDKNQKNIWRGTTASFTELQQTSTGYIYQAEIRPHAWWLTLTEYSHVQLSTNQNDSFPGTPIKDTIYRVAIDGGLPPQYFSHAQMNVFFSRRYVCQYEESYYAFIARWLEFTGNYYFIDQSTDNDVLTIMDGIPAGTLPFSVPYSENYGLDSRYGAIIYSFHHYRTTPPKRVVVKDYNPERPEEEILATLDVDPHGAGDYYVFSENVKTQDEAEFLAKIRRQEFLCRKNCYLGESTIPQLRPGFLFSLTEHQNESYNQPYFIEKVTHEIHQESYLQQHLKAHLGTYASDETSYYKNSFTCLPADVPYRPRRNTPWPKIAKNISAHIETQGTTEYAQLDEQGRYYVRLPFDVSTRGSGRASCPLHMAKPYAGEGHGMHFPLPAGTEVMLGFVDGHPDRPYIAAAIPNPVTASPVTQSNQTIAEITSLKKNIIRIQDLKTASFLLFHCTVPLAMIQQGTLPTNKAGSTAGIYEYTGPRGIYVLEAGGAALTMTGQNHTEIVSSDNAILTIHGNRTESTKGNYEATVDQDVTITISDSETITCKSNSLNDCAQFEETIAEGSDDTVVGSKTIEANLYHIQTKSAKTSYITPLIASETADRYACKAPKITLTSLFSLNNVKKDIRIENCDNWTSVVALEFRLMTQGEYYSNKHTPKLSLISASLTGASTSLKAFTSSVTGASFSATLFSYSITVLSATLYSTKNKLAGTNNQKYGNLTEISAVSILA